MSVLLAGCDWESLFQTTEPSSSSEACSTSTSSTDPTSSTEKKKATDTTVPAAVVNGFEPAQGRPGTQVVIDGAYLSDRTLSVGNVVVQPDPSSSAVALRFTIPALAHDFHDIRIDGAVVGTFRVLEEAVACPAAVAAGEPVELSMTAPAAASYVRFVDPTTGTVVSEVEGKDFDSVQPHAVAIRIPEGLATGVYEVVTGEPGAGISVTEIEVLGAEPEGPATPDRIEYPDLSRVGYIPPITNNRSVLGYSNGDSINWTYAVQLTRAARFDCEGSNWWYPTCDEALEADGTGFVYITEYLYGARSDVHHGQGTFDMATNHVEFTMVRDDGLETYVGGFGNLEGVHAPGERLTYDLVLRSTKTCRQLVIPLDSYCP